VQSTRRLDGLERDRRVPLAEPPPLVLCSDRVLLVPNISIKNAERMGTEVFFSMAEYWQFYGAFLAFVFLLLALDLGVFHKTAHDVSVKEAAIWSVIWIALALCFNYGLYHYVLMKVGETPSLQATFGPAKEVAERLALEFLTGYVVEKSLSVDNIFVFVVVFSFFGIPNKYQHRVLFYGILGALFFRAIFIALGSVLMQYEWIVWFFGGFLILTGVKIFFAPDKPLDPDKNPIIRLLKKMLPVTQNLEGQSFFVRREGRLFATPLFVALVFVELTDIVFAVDSVPAIFAITSEPFIVFTSNVFAILGLRALYFLLAGVMDKFYLLKYGLGVVLIFVGLKMVWLNHMFGGKFPISWSLGIIGSVIGLSVLLSFLFPKQNKEIRKIN
jgi:tellurite resistance protein TerC